MRRREFIGLLGAATWAVCARAQTGKTSRIGFLGPSSPSQEAHVVGAFRQKLRDLGHVEGDTFVIEFRWAEGRDSRLPSLAGELVRLRPDVIVTTGTPGSLATKRATSTIPIVFASSGNPVAAGLVPSFSRPGGNVTGFTVSGPELEGKRVQLLKEVVPQLSRVAVVWNSANPAILDFYQQTRAAGAALGFAVEPNIELSHADEFKAAFATIAKAKPDAMMSLRTAFCLRIGRRLSILRQQTDCLRSTPIGHMRMPEDSYPTHQTTLISSAARRSMLTKYSKVRSPPTLRFKSPSILNSSLISRRRRRWVSRCRHNSNNAQMK